MDSTPLEFSQFGEPASHCLLYPRLIRHLITLRADPQQLPRGCAIGLPPLRQSASKHLQIFLLRLIRFSLKMDRREPADNALLAVVEIVPVQHPASSIEDLDPMGTLDGSFLEGKDGSIVVEGVLLDGREGTHLGLVLFLSEEEVLLLLADLLTEQVFECVPL